MSEPNLDQRSDQTASLILEEKKFELEERKFRQARVDTWTRFWGTIIGGVLIAGAIQIYGIYTERKARATALEVEQKAKERQRLAEEATKERDRLAQKANIAIQLTNAREKALSDLRAQMFSALLQYYFKDAKEREQIALVKMMALNFRDAVQIKPLLELIDERLEAASGGDAEHLRAELRRAARDIIRDQMEQIRLAREGGMSHAKLTAGETVSPDCLPALRVTLEKIVNDRRVTIRTNSKDGYLLDDKEAGDSFNVTYFDTPLIDYTTVRDPNSLTNLRYSIILFNVFEDTKSAEIGVACLPLSAVGAQTRYGFDELLENFLH